MISPSRTLAIQMARAATSGLALLLCWTCAAPQARDAVAVYDSGAISKDEFQRYLRAVDKRQLRTDASISGEEGTRELLRKLAAIKILAAEVEHGEPETEPILYVSARANFLVEYAKDRIGKRSHEVTDEEVGKWYDDHLDERFTMPENIRFQHIFLRRDLHSAEELAALEGEIMKALGQGIPLADLIDRYTESGTRDKKGIVGPVFRGRLAEDFERQLYRLQPTDQPTIIRTEIGSHVVEVLDRREPEVAPLDEVKGQIVAAIIDRRDSAERDAYYEQLRERFNVIDHSHQPDLDDDQPVLTIKDRSLTRAQLDAYVKQGSVFGLAHAGSTKNARQDVIDNLIRFNLMYLDALEQGLDREANFCDRWYMQELRMGAATAERRRLDQWSQSVDEAEVLSYYQEHQARFFFPQRFDASYIFLPFGELPPFELQQKIEEIASQATGLGYHSPEFVGLCTSQGAICVNAHLTPTAAARIGPRFQRTLMAMEEPGTSPALKAENGLFVLAVHGIEARRAMVPDQDLGAIRRRFVSLEADRIKATIHEDILTTSGFTVISLPTLELPGDDE